MGVASILGVALTEDPGDAEGVGSSFKTWSAPSGSVVGQIVGTFPTGQKLVGPKINLNPAFAIGNNLLLGRNDFFQAFTVTFHENAVAPHFHLDW
jgi:hypothetical protein